MNKELENIIIHEKAQKPNPFLFTRIMQKIEGGERKSTTLVFIFRKVFFPALSMAMLSLGIFVGTIITKPINESIYDPNIAYFNDIQLEKLETLLINIRDEK